MPHRTATGPSDAEIARSAGTLSIGYAVAMAGELLHAFPLDFLDLMLVFAIASANVMRSPADKAGGKQSGPLPDRIGISRNAVSRALNIPLETVRRRIGNLLAKKVLVEQADGLVLSPDNPIGLGNNAQLAAVNVAHLRRLFAGLKAIGLRLDQRESP